MHTGLKGICPSSTKSININNSAAEVMVFRKQVSNFRQGTNDQPMDQTWNFKYPDMSSHEMPLDHMYTGTTKSLPMTV
jgi:hypothetical protein